MRLNGVEIAVCQADCLTLRGLSVLALSSRTSQ